MSNILLSFLGPTEYIEAYYSYNDKRTNSPCQFIQESLVELFCNSWKKEDRIIIFLTEESRQKNWVGRDEFPDANFTKGLKKRLKRKRELNASICPISIPKGTNEEEFEEMFKTITKNIEPENRIFFDVTNAFRSLPLLAFVSLNYARVLNNAKIEKILYGCMESLGNQEEVKKIPIDNRIIPIFDLTRFVDLFDWTLGVERFLETGNTRKLEELANKELGPQLRESKGTEGRRYRKLVSLLRSFEGNISTCRGPELKSTIKAIIASLDKIKDDAIEMPMLDPLLRKVERRFTSMNIHDHINCGLDVISWCIEHGLIQQGYTILRETIVNFIMIKILGYSDFKNREYRNEAENMLNSKNVEISSDVLNLWGELIQYRNDINHAGWKQDAHKWKEFEKKLGKFKIEADRLFQ